MVEGKELIGKVQDCLKRTDLADGLLLFVYEDSDPYACRITGLENRTGTAIYIPKEGPSVGITSDWEYASLASTGVLDEVRLYDTSIKEWREDFKELVKPLVRGKRTALNFSTKEAGADFLRHMDYEVLDGIFEETQEPPGDKIPSHLAEMFRKSQENFRKASFVTAEAVWKELGYFETRARPAGGREEASRVRMDQLKKKEGLTIIGGADRANTILLKYVSGVRHANRSAFFVSPDGKANLVVHQSEANLVRKNCFDNTIQYGENEEFWKLLSGLLEHNKKVLYDPSTMTEGNYRLLNDAAAKKLEPTEDILAKMMTVKLPEEIAAVRAGCSLTDKIVAETFGEIKEGMTEKQIYGLLAEKMEKAGVEPSFTPIVAIGKNSGNIHHILPTEEKAESGKNILIDVGVFVDGMTSDKTYNGYFGDVPSADYLKAHETVEMALRAALSKVKAGIAGKEPDKAARDTLKEAGYPDFNHSTGHPLGFEDHDAGIHLRTISEDPLPEEEIVTIEPGIYYTDKWGIRIETDVLVVEDGAELLSPVPELMVKKL